MIAAIDASSASTGTPSEVTRAYRTMLGTRRAL